MRFSRFDSNTTTAVVFLHGALLKYESHLQEIEKRENYKIICGFQLSMSDKATGEELVWFLDRWLAVDEDDGSLCRELPVARADRPSLPGN